MQTKPFPWKCPRCRERQVFPATADYTATIEHDGRPYQVHVPSLETPRCRSCNALVMVEAANRRVSEALVEAAGLLQGAQIRQYREALGLTQKQLAAQLAVAEATVSRWETGAQIQQRSLDRFLRLFFGLPDARAVLGNDGTLVRLGVVVPVSDQTRYAPVDPASVS